MSELKQARGVVVATAQNSEDRYGVRIGRSWFDGAGQCPVERGAEVEIAYSESGRFRSIEEIRVSEPAEEMGVEDASVERHAQEASVDARIARAVALKAAAALCWTESDVESVLKVAARFEQWLRATPQ
ncbi:MAG: hypothetical protein HY700_16815 [Gemmatimonadetes bacterium]|nr:hypothetical protein [Gemmatimonadota bacterium]